MAANSRRKGKDAEIAVVNWLRANGFAGADRRGTGFSGGDIIGIPGVSLEVKNTRAMELAKWCEQLTGDMYEANNDVGGIIHKRAGRTNPGEWYATMPVYLFAHLLRQAGHGDEL